MDRPGPPLALATIATLLALFSGLPVPRRREAARPSRTFRTVPPASRRLKARSTTFASCSASRASRSQWSRMAGRSSSGFGYADLAAKRPMTADHLLEIASVTKTMTGVVMMQLVQEGKVSLDDPAVKFPSCRVVQSRPHRPGHSSPPRSATRRRGPRARPTAIRGIASGWCWALRLRHAGKVPRRRGRGPPHPGPVAHGRHVPAARGQGDRRAPCPCGEDLRRVRREDRRAGPLRLHAGAGERGIPRGRLLLERRRPLRVSRPRCEDVRSSPRRASAELESPAVTPDGRELPYGIDGSRRPSAVPACSGTTDTPTTP